MTNPKQRNIVESKMESGQIQLGVKKSSGKSSDQVPTQGFFYGGVAEEFIGREGWHSYNYGEQLRQHLILQTICWQRATSGCGDDTLMPRMVVSLCSLPASYNFYDIPSQKRVARCTNIPRTGALLTVKGVGQRLRKGFQKQWRELKCRVVVGLTNLIGTSLKIGWGNLPAFESLSSAAEIRHSARNTRLWDTDLCLACTYR